MKVKIMRGIPGSGKSTYVRKNFRHALVCSADDFFMEEGQYKFDPSKLSQAHGACLRKFVDGLVQNANNTWPYPEIVVDNTNTRLIEVAPYAALALAYGYELEITTILSLPKESFDRQVHGVPLETINRMYSNLMDSMYKFPSYWPHIVVPR